MANSQTAPTSLQSATGNPSHHATDGEHRGAMSATPTASATLPHIVSIVVPTFNRFERLRRCIDKIKQNVTHPHEIIVVDGGSTDGTREWLLEERNEATKIRAKASESERRIRALCASQGSPNGSREAADPGPFIFPSRAPRNPEGALHALSESNRPLKPSWSSTLNSRLILIFEPQREGAVKAFNKGFRASTGHYVLWLNDDAFPLPGSVEAAVAMLERPDLSDVGMAAFYHNWHSERNVIDRVTHDGESYKMCHVRGYPYANFGLLRRSLLEKVGFADERYYFFGFDPDLSLKIQLEQGLQVLGCRQALIHHDEQHDERKQSDLAFGDEDNAKLFAKWPLPPRDGYPDPRAAYRELLDARRLW